MLRFPLDTPPEISSIKGIKSAIYNALRCCEMTTNPHIDITPGTCGGKPRIAGSRIRVSQIVLLTEQGQSPDAIVAAYPHLSLAGVYAALAFYHDNRDAIDEEIREADDDYAQVKRASQLAAKDGPEAREH